MRHAQIAVILLFVGVLLLGGGWFVKGFFEERDQLETSDARAVIGEYTIGVDNWAGYFPLCSPEMVKRMRVAGYIHRCEDDSADYPGRFDGLKKGKIDFAVATVDSDIIHGAPRGFPGTLFMVIDESKGGDAVIAQCDFAKNIDDLKRNSGYKTAFTPSSPSEHLLKVIGSHFDVPTFRDKKGAWRVETNGSQDALKKLLAGEVPVAVLWEPDVTRAIADGRFCKILGTEDTDKVIVDILLANVDYARKNPEVLQTLLENYFRTLKFYTDNPEDFKNDMGKETGLSKDQVAAMLGGIAWQNLHDNATIWFGANITPGTLPSVGIVDAIDATVQILIENGDFSRNPLPNGDPYRIIYSKPVKDRFESGITTQFGNESATAVEGAGAPVSSLEKRFAPLSDDGWKNLREVGTLKVHPITFQSGSPHLDLSGKEELDQLTGKLARYPNFRILVEGHTALRGDPEANRALSQSRAEAVARYYEITYNIDPNRMLAVGRGADDPLPLNPGERPEDRSYTYRLPRVEIHLMAEMY